MNVLWLTKLVCLGFGAGAGDIDHGKQGKDQGLNEAGEQIKIQRQYRRDTQREDRHTGQNAEGLQSAEHAQRRHKNAEHQHGRFLLLSPQQQQCRKATADVQQPVRTVVNPTAIFPPKRLGSHVLFSIYNYSLKSKFITCHIFFMAPHLYSYHLFGRALKKPAIYILF